MKLKLFFALFLTLIIASCETNFPEQDQESGLIPIGTNDDMFYWIWFSQDNKFSDPVIIWLSGGPGCSCIAAVFMQTGPFYVTADLSLNKNLDSWNKFATVVYLDQPLGTGFSLASSPESYATNKAQIADRLYEFMLKFFEKYDFLRGNQLYIQGESYGGHFAPAIGSHIVNHPHPYLNLKGVSIANGVVDVETQWPILLPFALSKGLIALNSEEYNTAQTNLDECAARIRAGELNKTTADICEAGRWAIIQWPPKFNFFNIAKPCDAPICYDFTTPEIFVDQDHIKAELGVTGRTAKGCDGTVDSYLKADLVVSYKPEVENLLANGVRVFVYAGTDDFTCTYVGQDAWVNSLNWEGKAEMETEPYQPYETVGEYKKARNLVLMRVFNAGHLAPIDQPKVLADIYEKYIKDEL